MQASLVGIGLLLGLDSLFACVGLGMVSPSRARTRGLILGFAVCDGLASLTGASLGADRLGTFLRWGDWLAPVAIGLYGLFVIALAGRSRWPGPGASGDVGRPWVLLLPPCLSLDNLVVGFGPASPGSAGLSEAVLVGGLSGMGALVGLSLGAVLRSHLPQREKEREKGTSLNSTCLTLSRLHQTFTCMFPRLLPFANGRYQ